MAFVRGLSWRHLPAVAALLALLASGACAAAEPAAVGEQASRFVPARLEMPQGAPYLNATGEIRIVGYNDMQEMLGAINALFQRHHAGFRFELILKGTRTAPEALARGTSLLAPMGAEFSDEELAGYAKLGGGTPLMFRVAHDSLNPAALSAPLGVFVDARNPLARLSMAQVARVFTSGISTWGQLGLAGEWAERPVRLCGMAPLTALGRLMLRRLGAEAFAPGFAGFAQSRDAVDCVAKDPLAIGFASLNRGVPGVRAVPLSESDGGPFAGTPEDLMANRYPLDRHLLVYLRTDGAGRVDAVAREYLRFMLSHEGQRVIAAGTLGYLPLSERECAEELRRMSALETYSFQRE